MGHTAVLIGNTTDGFVYYSINGTNASHDGSGKPWGKNLDNNSYVLGPVSIKEAIYKVNNKVDSELKSPFQHNYNNSYVLISTSNSEDNQLNLELENFLRKSTNYGIMLKGESCVDIPIFAVNLLYQIRTKLTDKAPGSNYLIPKNYFNDLNEITTKINTIIDKKFKKETTEKKEQLKFKSAVVTIESENLNIEEEGGLMMNDGKNSNK